MTLLALYFFTALTVSFVCSLLETILLSMSHAHVGLLVKEGRWSGRILRNLKNNIGHPLAAILTLNTVASTLGAAGVGAQTFKVLGSGWVALASGLLTFGILVFSEFLPKTIGTNYWKQLSPLAAFLIPVIIFIFYPVVRSLEFMAHLIISPAKTSRVTREELIVLAEIGEHDGTLAPKETKIIQNLLLLREVNTRDILTPRSVMLAVHENDTVGEIMAEHAPMRFTRIPVYGRDRDDLKGVVYRYDIMEAYYTNRRDETAVTFLQPLHAVPDTKPLADLLDEFINRREHMFQVVDEYGGTAGIVTLEDVIESLLDMEIVDEFDSVVDMQAYALERWQSRHNRSGT